MARDPQGGCGAGGLTDCVSVYGGGGPGGRQHGAGSGTRGYRPRSRHRRRSSFSSARRSPFAPSSNCAPCDSPTSRWCAWRLGAVPIYTLRATARLRLADGRLSDLSRSVGATVDSADPVSEPATRCFAGGISCGRGTNDGCKAHAGHRHRCRLGDHGPVTSRSPWCACAPAGSRFSGARSSPLSASAPPPSGARSTRSSSAALGRATWRPRFCLPRLGGDRPPDVLSPG